MERLRDELLRPQASPLIVQSLVQLTAVHLARNYGLTDEESRSGSPSLAVYKLRQLTDWMAEHFSEEFNLARPGARGG